jgi:3-oxoacyl-[acyl-carrier-protein] synthase II
MIGHTVAAAGAIEAAVTVRSISEGRCHPTRNLAEPDAVCDLFYCPDGPVEADIKAAMSNSCGFSGGNSCVVFKKY